MPTDPNAKPMPGSNCEAIPLTFVGPPEETGVWCFTHGWFITPCADVDQVELDRMVMLHNTGVL